MYIIIFVILILLNIIYIKSPNLHIENSAIPFYKRKDNIFPDIKDLNEINILCCSGLSNRIRTILGFLEVCNIYKKKLNVIWIKDNTCNGDFLKYFEPIKNVTFIKLTHKIHYYGQSTIQNITSNYNIHTDIAKLYKNIKLNDIMKNKLQTYITKNNVQNLVGIHVRRTDYTGNIIGKLINGSNSDEDFFHFIKKYSKDKDNFFLATDNRETQDIYINKYKNKVLYFTKIKKTNNLRKTSLENAILDIYILSYCKKIKGTYNSSFTEFAKYLKKSRKF